MLLGVVGGAFYIGKIVSTPPRIYPTPSPSLPLPASTLAPAPNQTIDENANWKTYTNSKYGYSIKYPGNWYAYREFDAGPTGIAEIEIANEMLNDQEPPREGYLSVLITIYPYGFKMPMGKGIQEYLSADTDLVYFLRIENGLWPEQAFKTVHKETKIIAGREAIRFVGGNFNTPWMTNSAKGVFSFDFIGGSNSETAIADKILSTFKFTE